MSLSVRWKRFRVRGGLKRLRTMMFFVVLIAIGAAAMFGSPALARSALEHRGYQDITMQGKRFFSLCGESTMAEGFSAIWHGTRVTGYVCTSPFYSYVIED